MYIFYWRECDKLINKRLSSLKIYALISNSLGTGEWKSTCGEKKEWYKTDKGELVHVFFELLWYLDSFDSH